MSVILRSLTVFAVFCTYLFLLAETSNRHQGEGSAGRYTREKVSDAIALPTMKIVAHDREAYVRQIVTLAIFVEKVESSELIFDHPEGQFTDGGYISVLEPKFAVRRRLSSPARHVLVFGKGDAFINQCFPHIMDLCARLHTGEKDEVKDFFVLPKKVYALGEKPNLIVILYGPRESFT